MSFRTSGKGILIFDVPPPTYDLLSIQWEEKVELTRWVTDGRSWVNYARPPPQRR